MLETDCDTCRVVAGSLSGEREVDEQTYSCLEVLSERLDCVRGMGGVFSGVDFSPAARRLLAHRHAVGV